MTDFTRLPDLANRALGGAVVAANDEFFAARENLVLTEPAAPRSDFGHKGKQYDGWETRRRRAPGHDWAIVRLGAAGIVAGVVVDTAHFSGNYPPHGSLDGAAVEGHCSVDELTRADWQPLLPLSDLAGNTTNYFPVYSDRRVTHVRLNIHPDGGVARLRVHGTVLPDPRLVDAGPFDLAALENGGRVTAVSNEFYGRPAQLIGRGLARSMGEGWETARRRDCRQRLGRGGARLRGRRHPGRAGHVLLPRQRTRHGRPDRLRPRRRGGAPAAHPAAAGHPAPIRARAVEARRGPRAARRLPGRRAWPGCGCGAGRPPPGGLPWAGAGSTRCPTSRRSRCSAPSGLPPQEAGRLVGARPVSGDLPPAAARLIDGPAG